MAELTEIQEKALLAIAAGRNEITALRAELGDIADWKTPEELDQHVRVAGEVSSLTPKGLTFRRAPFRQPRTYGLTRQGRAVVAQLKARV